MPRITLKNLYRKDTGLCRFCSVKPGEKHGQYYHGFQDMMGIDDLNLEYEK